MYAALYWKEFDVLRLWHASSQLVALQAAMEAAALQQQLKAIFESMPRDLQQTMLSSPQRAALLQGSGPQTKASPDGQPADGHQASHQV